MAATREDVDRWIETGKKDGATHIVSVCDTFDYDDYPVYVKPGQDPFTVAAKYQNHSKMSKVNEIIDLTTNPPTENIRLTASP